MSAPTVIHWFERDLRLDDNTALIAAARAGRVLPVYVLDETHPGELATGAAWRCRLHRSLQSLAAALDRRLLLLRGDPLAILPRVAAGNGAAAVHWNRRYEPWARRRDAEVAERLREAGVEAVVHDDALLWAPEAVVKPDGGPYRVFTPYFKRCLIVGEPARPRPAPDLRIVAGATEGEPDLAAALLPAVRWDEKFRPHWSCGEDGAAALLASFLAERLSGYADGRDLPAQAHTSGLSPALTLGEISPRRVWHAAAEAGGGEDLTRFHTELGWREFAYHLLHHCPELPTTNLQRQFDDFPWRDDAADLARWQRGRTGIPMVDAGMRELWETGIMHNRLRMITGSFLVKNLLLDWRLGERWFRDCLADADLASNSFGWQWVAGCGADAAPFFRVFNPVTQGRKFDADGAYVRRWVPELAALPDRHLHAPWEAAPLVLLEAGVTLGRDYPEPMVDLKSSRQRALDAYAALRRR